MGTVLRNAVQLKRQTLINKLIKVGIYKKDNKQLYELTLTDLEKEYEFMNGLVPNLNGKDTN